MSPTQGTEKFCNVCGVTFRCERSEHVCDNRKLAAIDGMHARAPLEPEGREQPRRYADRLEEGYILLHLGDTSEGGFWEDDLKKPRGEKEDDEKERFVF